MRFSCREPPLAIIVTFAYLTAAAKGQNQRHSWEAKDLAHDDRTVRRGNRTGHAESLCDAFRKGPTAITCGARRGSWDRAASNMSPRCSVGPAHRDHRVRLRGERSQNASDEHGPAGDRRSDKPGTTLRPAVCVASVAIRDLRIQSDRRFVEAATAQLAHWSHRPTHRKLRSQETLSNVPICATTDDDIRRHAPESQKPIPQIKTPKTRAVAGFWYPCGHHDPPSVSLPPTVESCRPPHKNLPVGTDYASVGRSSYARVPRPGNRLTFYKSRSGICAESADSPRDSRNRPATAHAAGRLRPNGPTRRAAG